MWPVSTLTRLVDGLISFAHDSLPITLRASRVLLFTSAWMLCSARRTAGVCMSVGPAVARPFGALPGDSRIPRGAIICRRVSASNIRAYLCGHVRNV